MNKMKYRIGDVVWFDGELHIIDELSNDGSEYSVRNMETGGSSAWWYDNQLEYVDHIDGKEIFTELDEKFRKRKELHRDLKYIKEHYPKISSISWLKLLEEIGYDSSFNRNGEYFCLQMDIITLYPLFTAIMKQDRNSIDSIINEVFNEPYREEYKTRALDLYEKMLTI